MSFRSRVLSTQQFRVPFSSGRNTDRLRDRGTDTERERKIKGYLSISIYVYFSIKGE